MNMNKGSESTAAVLSRAMQMQLTAAFERGEDHTLIVEWLTQYPELSDDIINFSLALQVVAGPEVETSAEFDPAIARGIARAMARVAVATAPALGLREALRAAGVQKPQVANQLRIGVDVLDKFVKGTIDLASVPHRFFERLGQALNASVEQARAWAEASAATGPNLVPSLQRGPAQTPDSHAPVAHQSFAEAVTASTNMSPAERTDWLALE